MIFEVSSTIVYEAIQASTLVLNIEPFPSSRQQIREELLSVTEPCNMKSLAVTRGEKRLRVLEIAAPGKVHINYKGLVSNDLIAIPAAGLDDVPIINMPSEVLAYLTPSRYCQSDKLYKFAYHNFGHINHAFEKVMAIRNWIHRNVEYAGGYTNPQTSAYDTITEQVGVCRDFAHLGVALCRALTIPARYFTGYAYQLNPPDFHACFEAYLGGHWIIVDATKLVPLNGLIKIATGVDATDTAFANIFGHLNFQQLNVNVSTREESFEAVNAEGLAYGYSCA
ncbi:transglutaminase-like enzyme, putative cysteine protease [Pedobacter sp. BAL39]|uniref:transglutaminase-like domain-containing protein n=1 Tax=Pedobacter sp. BAL39 TaxID=391596 RepID=UPI0001559697|nr:transglutaminase family protein [Pedobacter sp. BAL39]EDM38563.1 transglutaminase-like enzyme, putative cysteine protease [Pedobacter sp. BAL39]